MMDEKKTVQPAQGEAISDDKKKKRGTGGDSDNGGEPQVEVKHRSLGPEIERKCKALEAQKRWDRQLGG